MAGDGRATAPNRYAIKRGRGIAAVADLLELLSDRQFSWPALDIFCLSGKDLGHYHYDEKFYTTLDYVQATL